MKVEVSLTHIDPIQFESKIDDINSVIDELLKLSSSTRVQVLGVKYPNIYQKMSELNQKSKQLFSN